MNVGSLGGIIGAAGAPLGQAKSAEIEQNAQEAANQTRRADADKKAEKAAGLGEAEQDEQASERDADGRRLWEKPVKSAKKEENQKEEPPPRTMQSRDPSGNKGTELDLTG